MLIYNQGKTPKQRERKKIMTTLEKLEIEEQEERASLERDLSKKVQALANEISQDIKDGMRLQEVNQKRRKLNSLFSLLVG